MNGIVTQSLKGKVERGRVNGTEAYGNTTRTK